MRADSLGDPGRASMFLFPATLIYKVRVSHQYKIRGQRDQGVNFPWSFLLDTWVSGSPEEPGHCGMK